jgi:uncharacterized membrane protein (DUF106 family)
MVAEYVIPIASFLYVGATIWFNRFTGTRQKMKKIQAETSAYQKELAEAAKANDEKKMERLKLREKEVTGKMMEMMWLPWKSMVFILPAFFLLIGTSGFLGINFPGLIPSAFPDFIIVLPFGIHLPEILSLNVLNPSVYGARGYFIVWAIISGFILEAVVSRFEKQAAAVPAPNQTQ